MAWAGCGRAWGQARAPTMPRRLQAAAAPGLDWVSRWLPLFYVPSLVVLPLALKGIAGEAEGGSEAVGRRAAPDVVGVRAQLAELGRALDVLAAQPGVDGRRLALVGHDFGAMFGVVLAADDPRLRWCVLMAGAPTLSEWYLLGKKSPGLEYQRRLGQFDPAKAIGRACSGGILFQFSAHDRYVPAVRAEALVAAARSPKTAISYDAGHDLKLEKAFQDRQAWLRRRLAPAAQRP